MTDAPLQRRFGLLQSTALNMSNMIGIGPFITIPALMSALGGPQSMIGWIIGVVIALADGMVWAELGAAMPGSGGSYVYLRECFGRAKWGRLMAFLFIWQFIISGPMEMASGLIGFGQYLSFIWPGASKFQLQMVQVSVGLLTIYLLYRQISAVGKITISLWVGSLFTTLFVIVTGLLNFDSKVAFDFPDTDWQLTWGFVMGLGAASRVGMYDYLGYYDICYIGDEVKNPGKNIPRSILISVVAVAAIYMLMNLAIIGTVSWREFVPVTDPPAPVASWLIERLHGTAFAKVFTGFILWTAVGAIFALLLGYSRIPYAAARDGYFFKPFASVHPTRNFPHVSLLLIGFLAIAFSFLNLSLVIEMLLVTRIIVQFIGQIVGVMVLRKTQPQLLRPYRIWLYPLPCLMALVGWFFLFATSGTRMIAMGLGSLAVGVVAYFVWAKIITIWPFEKEPAPTK